MPTTDGGDSSSDDDNGDSFFNEEPDHQIFQGKKKQKIDLTADWQRNDEFSIDQRMNNAYSVS